MTDKNDRVFMQLEVDEDNQLVVAMSGNFPNGSKGHFTSLIALGFGLRSVLEFAQEETVQLGVDYMKEHGITYQSILDYEEAKGRLH